MDISGKIIVVCVSALQEPAGELYVMGQFRFSSGLDYLNMICIPEFTIQHSPYSEMCYDKVLHYEYAFYDEPEP